jgi:hypothetical protein
MRQLISLSNIISASGYGLKNKKLIIGPSEKTF